MVISVLLLTWVCWVFFFFLRAFLLGTLFFFPPAERRSWISFTHLLISDKATEPSELVFGRGQSADVRFSFGMSSGRIFLRLFSSSLSFFFGAAAAASRRCSGQRRPSAPPRCPRTGAPRGPRSPRLWCSVKRALSSVLALRRPLLNWPRKDVRFCRSMKRPLPMILSASNSPS